MDADFQNLMAACGELAEEFQDIVFIGGIAVYLHALNIPETEDLAETTHDADLYISLGELPDLREREILTSNKRLSKFQLIKAGFEFDIYAERQSALKVAYDEIKAHAETYDLFSVACPEHLLVLKMAAYLDRKSSTKGDKDARDLIRLAAILDKRETLRTELVCPHWDEDELDALKSIAKSSLPASMVGGNAFEAKTLRKTLNNLIDTIEKGSQPQPSKRPPKP